MEEQKKKRLPKTPEAAARKKAHQFGQPGGNPIGDPGKACSMREFYKWAENKATEEELKAYVADKEKPFARRKFIMTMQAAAEMKDFFELTNQTHGAPKQQIEIQDMPVIECKIFGEE